MQIGPNSVACAPHDRGRARCCASAVRTRQNHAMRIGLTSDTHMPWRVQPLHAAHLIIHAGDHCELASLEVLTSIGPPFVTIHGEVDTALVCASLPRETEVTTGNTRIAVIHNASPAAGHSTRLREHFPSAETVGFGHSHIPYIERDGDGLLIITPGSPTDRRRRPLFTMAELVLERGRPPGVEIIDLDAHIRPNL